PNIEWLIAARLIMGIGIGAETVCGYVMIGEFAPPSKRGLFAGIIAVATNSALFAGNLFGMIIIPTIGWRFMFVLVGVGALATWFFRRNLPESPRWLENKGRFEEAEAVLQKIEAEAELRGPLPPAVYQPITVVKHAPISAMLKPDLLARLFVGSMIIIGVSATLYGFITWLPTFFVKQGLTVSSSLVFTTAITLGSPLGNLSSIFLSSRVNRKTLLATLAVIAAVLGIIYPSAVASWQIIGLGFLIAYVMGIMIGIGWALYVPELFPTELRMRGVGICNSVGRIMSIAMPYAIVALFENWGVSGVVFTLSGILFLAAIVIVLFGVETRNQSLEAINGGLDDLLVANRELKGVHK
ncbi:MAG: MFS transporter, partial [Rhizobium sp.]